ncbi:MAG: hypothetical protein N2C13_03325 [Chloroflexota bacterium]
MKAITGKTLRIVAVVFMGLAATMNILGGIGTVCAAFLTKDYPPMWVFMDYQWQYQTLMITTIAIGIAGVWSTMQLVGGGKTVYRNALIILSIGTLLSGTQYFASLAIRGKGVPANIKFYTNVVGLIIFLILKAPGIRERMDFVTPMRKAEKMAANGMASFVAGIVIVTIFAWAGPSHMYQGNNWVEVLDAPLIAGGVILVIGGLVGVIRSMKELVYQEKLEVEFHRIA